MDIDLNALEQAALAATEGPWFEVKDPPVSWTEWIAAKNGEVICEQAPGGLDANMTHIAAANPAAILELIRRLRAAEAAAAANLAALNLKAGDMLVVRTDAELHQHYEQFAAFANGLRAMLPEGVQAMILPDAVEVSAMPEGAMRSAGWVRVEKTFKGQNAG